MKKIDIEKALADPEGLKKLSERATLIRQKHGTATDRPVAKLRQVQLRPTQVCPTPAEIKVNDQDHAERRHLLANISRLVPDLANEPPKSALEKLVQRYKEKPSTAGGFLVEDAINRLTISAKLDTQTEKLVDEAIRTLGATAGGQKRGTARRSSKDTDSIWSRLYRHSDYEGRSLFINHDPGWVYRRIRKSALSDANLNDRISSLYVDASSTEVGGKVILFQNDRFTGRFAMFSTTAGAPDERAYTPYVGDFINDRTSSILVVRQYENEFAVALGDFGLRDTIEDFVNGVDGRISLRGDPIITWDMWPSFSPERRYIYLRIPVEVAIDWWPDYDAEVRYWIYLYVNADGDLRGYVDWYGAWAESGWKSDDVVDGLMDAIPNTIDDVNGQLNTALAAAALFAPFERQYFLPGTAGNTGYTDDDLTLVLVRR
ncbi:MAG: hypothetical protein HYX84_08280 [Chloroflexi bacterium]|nr:hypothetical protein [Chloroflexota bacterium]